MISVLRWLRTTAGKLRASCYQRLYRGELPKFLVKYGFAISGSSEEGVESMQSLRGVQRCFGVHYFSLSITNSKLITLPIPANLLTITFPDYTKHSFSYVHLDKLGDCIPW